MIAPPVSAAASQPARSGFAASETARWLRRWVGLAVAVLALLTVLLAFVEEMPHSHHVAVPAAVAVMVAAWTVELAGARWPRLTLVAAVVLPNAWLTLMGHFGANYLFLLLLVVWVGLIGSPVERAVAPALSLAVLGLGIARNAVDGDVGWGAWISYLVVVLMAWSMGLVLRRQDRMVAELRLRRSEAEQRGREMAALADAARDLASTLELRPLLDLLLDHLGRLLPYHGTALLVVEGDELCFAHMRGPESFSWEEARRTRYPIADFRPVWDRLAREEPVVVPDVRGPSAEAATFRSLVGAGALDGPLAFIASLMWVPLVVRGQIIGVLSITNPEVGAYGPRDATLALAIARQAAVAIENARLYESAERRARDLEAVFQADRRIYQSLRIPDVLDALVDVAAEVLRADRTSVMVWDERHERLVVGAVRGFGPEVVAAMSHGPGDGITWVVATTGEPVAIEDAAADPRVAHRITGPEGIRSVVHVPLVVGGEVFGVFGVNFREPRRFDGQEQRVLSALAQRAAVAIENARLHERDREVGVLEERQRLARELHDSVTQALYGASLHAEAATRALADGDLGPVRENLRDIRDTVQEALGEMRLLLFELRPAPLEDHGLAGALQMRLRAVEARSGLAAEFEGDEALRLRPETERELYRVAQEALNNVLKHAHASRVTVRLDGVDGHAALEVADDGVGFEPDLRGGGGFGLPGMLERVERLGGSLRVDSAPGSGTRVRVEVPR